MADLPTIQIGPVSDDPAESVSVVNKSFIRGLTDQYRFAVPSANRKHGNARLARFNAWNIVYLITHTASWLWSLLRHRPAIAHYAISSGWAMKKGLLFLRLARSLGARTVGHLHSGGFISHWNRLSDDQRSRAKAELLKLDAFIVLSERWKRVIVDEIKLPADRIFVVNNPIEDSFEAAALQIPVPRAGKCILSLGVMGRDKGVFEILTAMEIVQRRHPDIQLTIAGPEREPGIVTELAKEIENRGLQGCVKVRPGVFGEEKLKLFRESSVFLLPSHYENFPLVVLEAAAAGQAIISTPVGATPEFFTDGISALFVPIKEPAELAEAILRILENTDQISCLGSEARRVFITKLSRQEIMSSLRLVYQKVLSAPYADSR